MKHLLLFVTLLFSAVAFATDKEVAITGIDLQEGQSVSVIVKTKPSAHIIGFKVKESLTEEDEFTVQLTGVDPGRYELTVIVRDSALGPVVFRRNAYIEIE